MRRLDLIERDLAFNAQQADDEDPAAALPPGSRHYMTPGCHARLKTEVEHLLNTERPALVKVVTWAASNGDRSENADYQYGKRRLREIDRRIRYLTQRLDGAEVIDPARPGLDQVFFGATVTYCDGQGAERTVSIVGADEVDTARGRISWLAPVARALNKAREGDSVRLRTPGGEETLEVLSIQYVALDD
jgi:transcription elongation factor GreB